MTACQYTIDVLKTQCVRYKEVELRRTVREHYSIEINYVQDELLQHVSNTLVIWMIITSNFAPVGIGNISWWNNTNRGQTSSFVQTCTVNVLSQSPIRDVMGHCTGSQYSSKVLSPVMSHNLCCITYAMEWFSNAQWLFRVIGNLTSENFEVDDMTRSMADECNFKKQIFKPNRCIYEDRFIQSIPRK